MGDAGDVDSFVPDPWTAVGRLFVLFGAPTLVVATILTLVTLAGWVRWAVRATELTARVASQGVGVAVFIRDRFVGGTSALVRVSLRQGCAVAATYLSTRLLYVVGGSIYGQYQDWWTRIVDVFSPPSPGDEWTAWPALILLGALIVFDGALAARSTVAAWIGGWSAVAVAAALVLPALIVGAGFVLVFVISLVLFLLQLLVGGQDTTWTSSNLVHSPIGALFTAVAIGTAILINATVKRSAEVLWHDHNVQIGLHLGGGEPRT